MADPHSTRPAVTTNRTTVPVITIELFDAAFSTLGAHPSGGVALVRTLDEAQPRLADMLVFADN